MRRALIIAAGGLRSWFFMAIVGAGCATQPAHRACPIPGDAIQWRADLCLFETETDDIIAAQPCMDRESAAASDDACMEKQRYKVALCTLAVERGLRSGSVEACISDPTFSGPTVRRGGV